MEREKNSVQFLLNISNLQLIKSTGVKSAASESYLHPPVQKEVNPPRAVYSLLSCSCDR